MYNYNYTNIINIKTNLSVNIHIKINIERNINKDIHYIILCHVLGDGADGGAGLLSLLHSVFLGGEWFWEGVIASSGLRCQERFAATL